MNLACEDASFSVVVVGVGNPLLGDEGFGVEAVRRLAKETLPSGVLVLEGGTSSLDVFLDLGECQIEKLIVVDAVRAGQPPGSLVRVDLTDGEKQGTGLGVSLHDLGLLDSLRLARVMGFEPQKIVLLGVEPEKMEWGEGLTPRLKETLPKVLDEIKKEIQSD